MIFRYCFLWWIDDSFLDNMYLLRDCQREKDSCCFSAVLGRLKNVQKFWCLEKKEALAGFPLGRFSFFCRKSNHTFDKTNLPWRFCSNPCFCYESQLSRVVAERRRGRIFLETLLIPFQRLPKCISIMPLRLHVGKKKDFDSSSIASSSMAAEDQRGPKAHQQQVELFSKLDTKMHILLCCSRTTSIRNVHLML